MSRDYTPRHGAPRPARGSALRSLRHPVLGTGAAIALVTGAVVVVDGGDSSAATTAALTGRTAPAGDAVTALAARTSASDEAASSTTLDETERLAQARRQAAASRSETREQERLDAARAKARKAAAQKKAAQERKREQAAAAKERIAAIQKDPKPYAIEIMRDYGFADDEWGCLEALWTGESDFRWDATNSSSGAYGIPQALPASKMATAGSDWKTNPETQMEWGMKYIKDAYGSPCQAYQFWNTNNPHWY